VGFDGGPWKKYAKILGLKGGDPKISSNFAVTAFVVMQTAYENAKNLRF